MPSSLTAYAGISGDQHYLTFDQKSYEFAGECSYLLARDFVSDTFSLVVSYERVGYAVRRSSLTLITAGHRLILHRDGRLELDGAAAEAPLYPDEDTAVVRSGHMLQVVRRGQLELACNLAYDHCLLSTSGWYFRKTGGLLGVYDYEPSTDFIKPDNTHTQQVTEFATAWTTERSCRPTNLARNNDFPRDSPVHSRCAELFRDRYSTLRACFPYLDPRPFMMMCLNDAASANDLSDYYCKAASFYVDQCAKERLLIKVPRSCGQFGHIL